MDRIGGAAGYRFGDVRVEGEGVYLAATLNRYTGMDIDEDAVDAQPGIGVPALIGDECAAKVKNRISQSR